MTTKHFKKAKWSDCEPILNLLKNGGGLEEREICLRCGFSGAGNLGYWRKVGEAPYSFFMAMKGLVEDLGGPDKPKGAAPTYDFAQTEILFSALRVYLKAAPGRKEEVQKLMGLTSKELARLAGAE